MKTLLYFILFIPLFSIGQQIPSKDLTFNNTGNVRTNIWFNDRAYAVAVQPDKKIIVGGQVSEGTYGPNSFAVVRYNEDGTLDTDFGVNGIVTSSGGICYDIILLDDGKIIIAGRHSSKNFIAKLLSDGSMDETFGEGGVSIIGNNNTYINDIWLLPDGSILCSGQEGSTYVKQMQVVKITSNGQVDTTFGDNGFVRSFFGFPSVNANALLVQPDGKFIIGGAVISDTEYPHNSSQLFLARFNADGSVDVDFGENGIAIHNSSTEEAKDMAFTSDLKIVVVGDIEQNLSGTYGDVIVTRFNNDGSLDETFGQNSGFTRVSVDSYAEYASSVIISPEGKIYLGGSYWDWNTYHLVIRFNEDGMPDTSFGNNGVFETAVRSYAFGVLDMSFTPDNKLVMIGYANLSNNFDFMTMRLILDTTLNIENNNLISEVRLYPNPVSDILNIKGISHINSVFIYDLTGKLVFSQYINDHEGFINISKLSSGTYLLKAQNSELSASWVKRIIKL